MVSDRPKNLCENMEEREEWKRRVYTMEERE
jgi:hypothetical protein